MCQFFFNSLFSSWDIKLKKKTIAFYLQTETTFFLFFRDLKNYKVLKWQASFFSKKCLLELAIVKTFIFFFKKSWFLYTSEYFRKICFVDENKNYSVPQTLLRDIVAKTAFKKRRTFNVSTVGNFSVQC